MRKVCGFTLVELLVAIAIVAVLSSILAAALMSAIRSGKATTCLSNQHQLQLAVEEYVADNSGDFPLYGIGMDRENAGYVNGKYHDITKWSLAHRRSLIDVLKPYGVAAEQFRCPLDTYFGTEAELTAISNGSHLVTSYVSGWVPYESYLRTEAESEVSTPATVCEFRDGIIPGHDEVDYAPLESVHGLKANFAFMDGHTKLMNVELSRSCFLVETLDQK